MSLRDEIVAVLMQKRVHTNMSGDKERAQADAILELFEKDTEGGQPNGVGEIEESWYRDWYTPERESHQRTTYTYSEPWEPKP